MALFGVFGVKGRQRRGMILLMLGRVLRFRIGCIAFRGHLHRLMSRFEGSSVGYLDRIVRRLMRTLGTPILATILSVRVGTGRTFEQYIWKAGNQSLVNMIHTQHVTVCS